LHFPKQTIKENKTLGLFSIEENKNFFFSALCFHFIPCLIKFREKYMFSSLPFILQRQKKKTTTLGLFNNFLTLPRITLARAKPTFFALQNKDFKRDNTFSKSESQRWKTYSIF
jgi:hypothetical protein